MLINCPIKSSEEAVPLIAAGADSFYGGVTGELLFGTTGVPANRRPWDFANFTTLHDFHEALSLVHRHGRKFYLTVNAHCHTENQIEAVGDFIEAAPPLDGLIVSDVSLIIALRKRFTGHALIASTGTNVQNGKTVEFYAGLGISEIVLPRHLTLAEIDVLTAGYPEMLFECFILHDDCAHMDGLCRYAHGIFDRHSMANACRSLGDFNVHAPADTADEVLRRLRRFPQIMTRSCGACAIQPFSSMNVRRVKIVGRQYPIHKKIASVRFINAVRSCLDLPPDQFVRAVKSEFHSIFGTNCGDDCLYEPS